MRGDDPRHDSMFSDVTPETRVRADHPLRPIRRMTDAALQHLSPRFDRLSSRTGRPSIPPEKLLRALLLQLLYGIPSERLLMEELDDNILYRWFVGLSLDDAVWDATTFTKNRDRLLGGVIAYRVLCGSPRGDQGRRVALRRALHGRWDAAGSVGESQELQAAGRRAAAAR
jgi:transposase